MIDACIVSMMRSAMAALDTPITIGRRADTPGDPAEAAALEVAFEPGLVWPLGPSGEPLQLKQAPRHLGVSAFAVKVRPPAHRPQLRVVNRRCPPARHGLLLPVGLGIGARQARRQSPFP